MNNPDLNQLDGITLTVYGISMMIFLIPIVINFRQRQSYQRLGIQNFFLMVNTFGFGFIFLYI